MRVNKISFSVNSCNNCNIPEHKNREYFYMPTEQMNNADIYNKYAFILPIAAITALCITFINIVKGK
ncbi:MAG: hypothetical protein LKG27_03635 [Clostridiaceae bacterium]|nr:hypothetical protein [Clostridiaceae bacterium]